MLALVWIAGPLSGVLVQPYVGLKSDNCRMRWGKRRPFIVGGAAATILSLMVLAWAKELMGGFLGLFGADPESNGVRTCIMLFAVLFVYVLDFAINVSKYRSLPACYIAYGLHASSPGRCASLHC
jgi:solute carrier family 45 protein 1/2/4